MKLIDGRPVLFHFHHKGTDFAIVTSAGAPPGGRGRVALASALPKVSLLRRVKGKLIWIPVKQSAVQFDLSPPVRFSTFSIDSQLKETLNDQST